MRGKEDITVDSVGDLSEVVTSHCLLVSVESAVISSSAVQLTTKSKKKKKKKGKRKRYVRTRVQPVLNESVVCCWCLAVLFGCRNVLLANLTVCQCLTAPFLTCRTSWEKTSHDRTWSNIISSRLSEEPD